MPTVITEHLDIWTTAQKQKKAVGRGRAKKDEVYGIKKLRELILELAVRGKLVPQDANDEPASVLLERITKEKLRLIKEGKIKKQKALPKFSEKPNVSPLPINWIWTRLGDISFVTPKNIAEDGTIASFVPMPLIATSHTGQHEQNEREWGQIKKGYTHFSNNDIGLAKITPCFENSKAVVFRNLKNGIGAGTTELHIARPYGNTLNSRYILLYLKSPNFLLTGVSKMTGTAGQKRIPRTFFAGNPLPLPPLAEQHRIVAKVDELMALCDQLEQEQIDHQTTHQILVETLLTSLVNAAKTENNQAKNKENTQDSCADYFNQLIAEHFETLFTTEKSIEQLKQTILQLAVMGKLVPQDPNDEPASVLLEKIAKEKAKLLKEGKIKKQKVLPKIGENEKTFELPNEWEWVRLGVIAYIRGGKRVSNGYKLLTSPTNHIYIRVSDMKNGSIDDTNLHFIDNEMFSKISQYIITKDDLYMTIVGATIGKCGLIPDKFHGMNLTENAARITPYTIDKAYLLKCLESLFCQNQFFNKTKQVGVQKMALGRLSSTMITLPPLHEQHRIVKKVNELLALCDSLKTNLNQAQTLKVQLADTLVKQAAD